MWNGKAFAWGLLAGGTGLFLAELAPMLRDPSLRYALDRPTTRSPGETLDEVVALGVLFTAMGFGIELLGEGRKYLEAHL